VSETVERFLPPASGLVPGSLCVLRDDDGIVRPAVVIACAAGHLMVQLASVPSWRRGDALTVSWSLSGHLRGIEATVVGRDRETYELCVAVGAVEQEFERRGVTRFMVRAEALLVVDGDALCGRASDVSVLGAGLLLPAPGPALDACGELLLHDAGQPLVPGVAVRVVFVQSDAPGQLRVGVEFDDATRSADATVQLLAAIDAYSFS